MAVFLLLLLSASSLFSASFDEVVSLALTASPDAEAFSYRQCRASSAICRHSAEKEEGEGRGDA